MTETRADFEAWFCTAYHLSALQPMENGCYLNLSAGMAWDAWQAGVAAEREACAKLCDSKVYALDNALVPFVREATASQCASAIRARSADTPAQGEAQ